MTAREAVHMLVAAFEDALADLERYATEVPFDRLVRDRDAFRMVSNALYVAAQAAIDLGEVLLKQQGAGAADTYRDIFAALARAKVIAPELAAELEQWASFRNVLAHLYTKLDLERVHRAYAEELAPLRELKRVAARALLNEP